MKEHMQQSFRWKARGTVVTAKHVYNTYNEWICLVDLANEFCVCRYVSRREEWICGRYFDSLSAARAAYESTGSIDITVDQ
jgi:hypothetical protein